MYGVLGSSSFKINNISLQNSTVALFQANSFVYVSATDASQYAMTISNCIFTNNSYTGFNLLEFNTVAASNLELYNTMCIASSYVVACEAGQYFNPVLDECTSKYLDYS
jgi:hypothetical protein